MTSAFPAASATTTADAVPDLSRTTARASTAREEGRRRASSSVSTQCRGRAGGRSCGASFSCRRPSRASPAVPAAGRVRLVTAAASGRRGRRRAPLDPAATAGGRTGGGIVAASVPRGRRPPGGGPTARPPGAGRGRAGACPASPRRTRPVRPSSVATTSGRRGTGSPPSGSEAGCRPRSRSSREALGEGGDGVAVDGGGGRRGDEGRRWCQIQARNSTE